MSTLRDYKEETMDDKTLLSLVEKFGVSQLAELELNDGTLRLVLRKEIAVVNRAGSGSGSGAVGGGAAAGGVVNIGVQAGGPGDVSAEPAVHLGLPVHAGKPVAQGEAITSPIVATFYRSPGPDSPPFADPGTIIKAGQTLCILEAMKMMNHLEAEFDCEILAVKAENGDLVEYGQTLFEVKRL
jgi:acetyl-CoA carboxylase biotin carboxyl carrier protein